MVNLNQRKEDMLLTDSLETRTSTVEKLRKQLSLTQRELAATSGVTRQTILKVEQFLLPNLPSNVAKALSAYLTSQAAPNYSPPDILQQIYLSERKAHIEDFTETLSANPFYKARIGEALNYAMDHFDNLMEESPVKHFREYLFNRSELPTSAIKFCYYTGMHPAVLSRTESGKIFWASCLMLQDVLAEVLVIPPDVIDDLGELHDSWVGSI